MCMCVYVCVRVCVRARVNTNQLPETYSTSKKKKKKKRDACSQSRRLSANLMQHNSRRRKPRPALSQKSLPLVFSPPPPFFSFLWDSEASSPHSSGGRSLVLLLRLVPFSSSLAAQGHVSFFFSHLIKKSSLNVLYFIQFVQIYSTCVSPHLQQEEEGEQGERGGGVPVTQVQGEEEAGLEISGESRVFFQCLLL